MPGVAAEAAHQFDILCPPLEQVHEANHYLYTLWNVMITIARSPDVTSDIHVQLVGILQILRQTSKGELDVYGMTRRDNTLKAALCIMAHPQCAYSAGPSGKGDLKRSERKIQY
ncbi:hypothetical protein M7I_1896 [Glarea lozoyensis 74030]|uniref:Uncharacterized protein n=1 Tax=Glarea lozoyensis (strain ATCC 74030 / MF5533) TaxID=1104152 RepID=H0EHB9_GLAL7|nr:hypothetical protein M7I_1896 [Glarea lozoyensis 74030]